MLKQISWRDMIKDTTPIFHKVKSASVIKRKTYWQLGTPLPYKDEVGVFIAPTCDNSLNKNQAYKPIAANTNLAYSSIDFSSFYLALLAKEPSRYQMPSFEYNIALSLFVKGEIKQAKLWLGKSASKETDIIRKNRIKRGMF